MMVMVWSDLTQHPNGFFVSTTPGDTTIDFEVTVEDPENTLVGGTVDVTIAESATPETIIDTKTVPVGTGEIDQFDSLTNGTEYILTLQGNYNNLVNPFVMDTKTDTPSA